jgi:glycoside/pentoside/hexuronide:cation symporter, GPH family
MTNSVAIPWYRLAGYGGLGIPLAMAALPVYVHLPKYYVDAWQLDLAAIGLILLVVRLLDAIQDPLLGYWSDRHVQQGGSRRFFLALGTPLMVIGMLAVFAPQPGALSIVAWLILGMLVVYLGFSILTVSYQAWGSELSHDINERTRITAWREGLSLIGVVLAAALPVQLVKDQGVRDGYASFAIVFAAVAIIGAALTYWTTPRSRSITPPAARVSMVTALTLPLRNRRFRKLLAIFVFNGVAASIPATLVLFFIADVIQRPDLEALFLISYFVAAAAGLPVWLALSKSLGKARAWLLAMVLAILAFVWAAALGAGDWTAFLVICIMSGAALGADLALPPSILADVIDDDVAAGLPRSDGAYFGLWALVTKLNLALAAGIALPLVEFLGYVPRSGATQGAVAQEGLLALAIVYAIVPCVLKCVAGLLLWRAPLAPHSLLASPTSSRL